MTEASDITVVTNNLKKLLWPHRSTKLSGHIHDFQAKQGSIAITTGNAGQSFTGARNIHS